MTASAWIWLSVILSGVILFSLYARLGKLLRCALYTAFGGIGALGVIWLLGLWVTVPVAVTPLTLAVSGVLGIPGVLAMLILYLI